MKVTIDSETLSKSLSRLKGITGGTGLERMVRVDADNGRICLYANNLLAQTEVEIDGTGEGAASFCVDLNDFLTVAKQAGKNSEVLIEYDKDQLLLSRERSQSRFEVIAGDTVPIWEEQITGAVHHIDGAMLRDALSRVVHCSPEDSRVPQLNSVFLTSLPAGGTRAVATDGHRLAMRDIGTMQCSLPENGLLIPLQSVHEIIRLAQEGASIALQAGENAASFSAGPETLTTKLVEGRYVDYMRVVLFEPTASARLPRAPFLEAVQHMNALLTGAKLTRLVFDQSGAHLETSRERLSSAESFDTNPHENIPSTGFNTTYLLDALKAFRGSEVLLEFSGESLDRIRLSDPDEPDYIQIIMPMRA